MTTMIVWTPTRYSVWVSRQYTAKDKLMKIYVLTLSLSPRRNVSLVYIEDGQLISQYCWQPSITQREHGPAEVVVGKMANDKQDRSGDHASARWEYMSGERHDCKASHTEWHQCCIPPGRLHNGCMLSSLLGNPRSLLMMSGTLENIQNCFLIHSHISV